MAPSSEGCPASVDQLKQQLVATFGCPGNGSLNIAELQNLLHNLIALHARYEVDRQKNNAASLCSSLSSQEDIATKQASTRSPTVGTNQKAKSSQEDIASKQASTRSPTVGTNQKAESTLHSNGKLANEGIGLSESLTNVPCNENVSGDLSTCSKDIQSSSALLFVEEGVGVDQRIQDGNSLPVGDEQRTSPTKNLDEPSKNMEETHRTNRARNSEIISQRSSDFNVKSTSSASTDSSMRMCEEKASSDTKTEENSGLDVIKHVAGRFPEISERVSEEHVHSEELSSPGGATETFAKADVPIPLPDLVAIMEGCKSHLETVKNEVLALRNRCESQYEDLLKLASGLDNLVERLDAQEPTVAKLEKDTHCLGMLISDYEQSFATIEKRFERYDTRAREIERAVQRVDKERDAIRGELRTVGEQANYLSSVKADRLDVQTELNRRALVTDMQLRVPYDVFNEGVRELTRFVTQMREEQHELGENLKTVQYELVRGLGAKASAQDVSQIRKQLVGVLARWQKAERSLQAATGDSTTQLIRGNYHSAAVAITGSLSHSTGSSTCLSCGIQTTLEGSKRAVPTAVRFVPSWKAKSHARNAGGVHTICAPPERVFRTGSLSMVPKLSTKHNAIQ